MPELSGEINKIFSSGICPKQYQTTMRELESANTETLKSYIAQNRAILASYLEHNLALEKEVEFLKKATNEMQKIVEDLVNRFRTYNENMEKIKGYVELMTRVKKVH